jgi:hypothetical protein
MPEFDRSRFEDLTHRHYAAIGEAASAWAEFEHAIQMAIWRLAGIDSAKVRASPRKSGIQAA